MNIGEVYTLSRNLKEVFYGTERPTMAMEIGIYWWFLFNDKITWSLYTHPPEDLSEMVLDWAVK